MEVKINTGPMTRQRSVIGSYEIYRLFALSRLSVYNHNLWLTIPILIIYKFIMVDFHFIGPKQC